MSYLTVVEMEKYTGFSRQTISAWLNRGKLQGKRVGAKGTPWLIPSDEVERVRLQRVAVLQTELDSISKPVPNGSDND